MKHQSLLLGILLTQAGMPQIEAKPISLYRIEGNKVSSNEKKVRQLANPAQTQKSDTRDGVDDFSDEFYDDVHPSKGRRLYQNEVDKLIQERRELFARNLVSMSMSLSFAVIIRPPPEPEVIESGDKEESPYDVLRKKLLGDNGGHEQNDEESINKANELASDEGKASEMTVSEPVEIVTDYAATSSDEGYVTVRQKLLGKGNDFQFQQTIALDIKKANDLAANNDKGDGGSRKTLRRR
jgi:hypothetical protein